MLHQKPYMFTVNLADLKIDSLIQDHFRYYVHLKSNQGKKNANFIFIRYQLEPTWTKEWLLECLVDFEIVMNKIEH